MESHSSLDRPQPKRAARWRWFTQWPGGAQVAFVFLVMVSGSSLMGSFRWVQAVVCALWIGWMILEANLSREDPRLQAWSSLRRITVTVVGILGIAYVVISGILFGF